MSCMVARRIAKRSFQEMRSQAGAWERDAERPDTEGPDAEGRDADTQRKKQPSHGSVRVIKMPGNDLLSRWSALSSAARA